MNRRSGTGRLWICLLALAAASACKRTQKDPGGGVVPALGVVHVEDLTPDEAKPAGARLDAARLAEEVRSKLLAAKVFSGDTPDGGLAKGGAAARVRIAVGMAEIPVEGKAAGRTVMRLRIDTRPAGAAPPHWNEDIEVGSETTYPLTPPPDRNTVFRKLVTRTLDDLLATYLARQRLWSAREGAVRAALLAADAGELRLEAIRVVGERKLTGAVPALLELLGHEDEATRDAALGALVEMREKRAVAALTKQRSMRDRREMRKILDAISTLGGDEATEYLNFVADAHEDEEIRGIAKQALERLRRRQGDARK